VAIDRPRRLLPFLALLLTCFAASGAPAFATDPIARVVTRVDAAMLPTAVITLDPQSDSALNRALLTDFRDALDQVGRLAPDGAPDALRLIYQAEAFGDRVASDTRIGRVEGDAEGRLDIELKLWSSGGGSSLFQGQRRTERISNGYRLNALLVKGETILWQGYLLTSAESAPPEETLGPLVQTLVDRLEISVDETIPLR